MPINLQVMGSICIVFGVRGTSNVVAGGGRKLAKSKISKSTHNITLTRCNVFKAVLDGRKYNFGWLGPEQKMGGSKLREYQGSNFLRQRLVLATITSTPVRITNIRLNSILKTALLFTMQLFRPRDDDPGLQEAEGGFIRLLDRLTNGSQVEFSFPW